MQNFSKYVIHHPSEGTEATIVDTEAEAYEIWTCTLKSDGYGNFENPATVWHMTDDCPARVLDGDWLEETQEEHDNASREAELIIRPTNTRYERARELGVGRYSA